MNDLINAEVNFTNRAHIAPGVTDYTLLNCDDHYEINGGVLSDSRLSWMSCGPRLTIINNIDGSVRNGWTFGKVKEDSTVKITCVSELKLESLSNLILIVGCESANHGGTVSFYHTGSSQILKTIQFNHKVISLAVVDGKDESNLPLARYIKSWSGVLAVGTGQGALYLVDLWKRGLEKCIVDCHFRTCDEQHISQLSLITFQKVDPTLNYRKLSINNGRTTEAIFLNEYTLMKNGLNHQLPRSLKQTDISKFPRDEVIVTAIEFFPNICTLAVGYNVSGFQLWDLRDFTLLYKSILMEIKLPVCKFALLEPSDDPRYVCYLWCLHQSSGEQKSLPFGAMYLINYESKVNNSFYGNIYQNFNSCARRFELDFGDEIPSVEDGRIISCRTANSRISKSVPYSLRSEDLNTEESCLTQLIITWEVWSQNREEVSNMITIFDLNQWYQEHMPNSSLAEYKGYMTHLTLQQFEEDTLLDVRINEQSLKPFSALYHLDQHYFPSSLSFDCVCLYRLNIVRCSRTGIQKASLDAIERGGPTALLNPTPLFKLCDYVGVKPLLADLTSNHVNNLSIKEQREVVLSIALENNMNGFLYQCVQEWADGSHAVAGSTLPALLGWAWGRVTLYKHTADKLCIPLFDYSGVRLDFNDHMILEHCVRQLHSLNKLFCLVMDKFKVFVLEDNLEQQCTALGLVSLYLDSVLWFLRNGVLPESLDGDDLSSDNHIPYLVNRITGSTKARRVELEYIASHQKNECPSSGLFFIDALINQECGGSHLTDQWELEGGATTLGKYPPPSVQSLLRIYLIRGIPTLYKHYIVIYFILDVINHLDSKRYNEHIERLLMFPTMFHLTNSQSRTIQAFWDLDHKHFEEGVNHLLHPDVCKQDLKCYQHRTILHLLVSEGKHKLALRYLNLKKPPLCEDDDIKFEMNLLLFNGMMLEAFSFQRQHQSLQMELLHQFFTRCFEVNKVDVIYKLPMNATEEMAFSKFLESNQKHKGEDLSVYYLVSRSRYLEAIDLHNKFRTVAATCRRISKPSTGLTPIGSRGFNIFGTKDNLTSGTPSDTVLTTRDLIINAISKTLPSVTKELTDHFSKEKQILPSSKQIQRPTPLSVAVHTEMQSDRLPRYRTSSSKFMEAALTKIRETWAPLLATPTALKPRTKTHMGLEDMPFLRTPSGQHRFNPTIVNRPPSPVLEKKAKRRQTGYFDPPNKRSKLESIISEGDKHSAKKDFSSSDSLLIINTPHVPRAVAIKNTIVSTPPSILKIKGKQVPNTSFMPELTPPKETNVKDECYSTVKLMLSNRQIRFSLPNNESPPSSPSFEEANSTQNETPIKPLLDRSSQSSILSRDLTPARKSLRTSWATSSMKQHILTRNISERRPSNKSTSNSSQKYTSGPLVVSSEKDEDESRSGTVESYCMETPRPENVNQNDDESNREDSISSEELKSSVEIEPPKFNIEYKLITKDSISTNNTTGISDSLEPLKFSFDYELVNKEDKESIEGYEEESSTIENIATVMESKQCDVSKVVETFSPSRDNSNKQYLNSFIPSTSQCYHEVKTNESISLPQTSTPVYNKFFFGDPNRKIPNKLESENKNVIHGDGQNIFTTSLNESKQSDITTEMKSNEIREHFTFKEKINNADSMEFNYIDPEPCTNTKQINIDITEPCINVDKINDSPSELSINTDKVNYPSSETSINAEKVKNLTFESILNINNENNLSGESSTYSEKVDSSFVLHHNQKDILTKQNLEIITKQFFNENQTEIKTNENIKEQDFENQQYIELNSSVEIDDVEPKQDRSYSQDEDFDLSLRLDENVEDSSCSEEETLEKKDLPELITENYELKNTIHKPLIQSVFSLDVNDFKSKDDIQKEQSTEKYIATRDDYVEEEEDDDDDDDDDDGDGDGEDKKVYQTLKPYDQETKQEINFNEVIEDNEENDYSEDDYYYEEEEELEDDYYDEQEAEEFTKSNDSEEQRVDHDVICLDSDSNEQPSPIPKHNEEDCDDLYEGMDDVLDYEEYSDTAVNVHSKENVDVDNYKFNEEEECNEEESNAEESNTEESNEDVFSSSENDSSKSILIETPDKTLRIERSWKEERKISKKDENISEKYLQENLLIENNIIQENDRNEISTENILMGSEKENSNIFNENDNFKTRDTNYIIKNKENRETQIKDLKGNLINLSDKNDKKLDQAIIKTKDLEIHCTEESNEENKEKIICSREDLYAPIGPSTSQHLRNIEIINKELKIVRMFFENKNKITTTIISQCLPFDATSIKVPCGITSTSEKFEGSEINEKKAKPEVEKLFNQDFNIDQNKIVTDVDANEKIFNITNLHDNIKDIGSENINIKDGDTNHIFNITYHKNQQNVHEMTKLEESVKRKIESKSDQDSSCVEPEEISKNCHTSQHSFSNKSDENKEELLQKDKPHKQKCLDTLDMLTLRAKLNVETGSLSALKRNKLKRRTFSDSSDVRTKESKNLSRRSISVTSINEEMGVEKLLLRKKQPNLYEQETISNNICSTKSILTNTNQSLNFSGIELLPNEVNITEKINKFDKTENLITPYQSDVNKNQYGEESNLNHGFSSDVQKRPKSFLKRRFSSLSNIKEIPEITSENQVSLFRSASTSDINTSNKNKKVCDSNNQFSNSSLSLEETGEKLNLCTRKSSNKVRMSLTKYRQETLKQSSKGKNESLEVVTSSDEDEVTIKKKLQKRQSVKTSNQTLANIKCEASKSESQIPSIEEQMSEGFERNVGCESQSYQGIKTRSNSVPPCYESDQMVDSHLAKNLRKRRATSEEIQNPGIIIAHGKQTKKWLKEQKESISVPSILSNLRKSIRRQNVEPLEVVESDEEVITVVESESEGQQKDSLTEKSNISSKNSNEQPLPLGSDSSHDQSTKSKNQKSKKSLNKNTAVEDINTKEKRNLETLTEEDIYKKNKKPNKHKKLSKKSNLINPTLPDIIEEDQCLMVDSNVESKNTLDVSGSNSEDDKPLLDLRKSSAETKHVDSKPKNKKTTTKGKKPSKTEILDMGNITKKTKLKVDKKISKKQVTNILSEEDSDATSKCFEEISDKIVGPSLEIKKVKNNKKNIELCDENQGSDTDTSSISSISSRNKTKTNIQLDLDSPAHRTRARRNSVMSESSSIDGKSLAAQRIKEDFGSPEKNSKRTTRRKSLLDSIKDTPVTPQNIKVDEYMPQRRLTRKQMSYLQNAEHSPNISSSKVEEEKSKNQPEPNVSQPRSLRNSPARSTRASSLSRK